MNLRTIILAVVSVSAVACGAAPQESVASPTMARIGDAPVSVAATHEERAVSGRDGHGARESVHESHAGRDVSTHYRDSAVTCRQCRR